MNNLNTLEVNDCRYFGYEFDSYTATGIAEGFIESQGRNHELGAWQYLVDHGLINQLQGWFARQANALIEAGFILPRN